MDNNALVVADDDDAAAAADDDDDEQVGADDSGDCVAASAQRGDCNSAADVANTVAVLVAPVAADSAQSMDAADDADDVPATVQGVLPGAVADADCGADYAVVAVGSVVAVVVAEQLRNLCPLHCCGSGVPPDLGLYCSPSS